MRQLRDLQQSETLEKWVLQVRLDFEDWVLPIVQDIAELWGTMRVLDASNLILPAFAELRLTVISEGKRIP